jgi:hypothetical protein
VRHARLLNTARSFIAHLERRGCLAEGPVGKAPTVEDEAASPHNGPLLPHLAIHLGQHLVKRLTHRSKLDP